MIPDGVQFPLRALVAFDRVHVGAGKASTVTLHIAPRQLAVLVHQECEWESVTGCAP